MKLSIITINYNGVERTSALVSSIHSVLAGANYSWEVVVVDNYSQEEDRKQVSKLENIVFIASSENLGFAGGNNLGIDSSRGEYIMLLNNDTEVKDDIFTPLITHLEQNPQIGAISPKIVSIENRKDIQFAGYEPYDRFLFSIKASAYCKKDKSELEIAREIPFIHGAAVITSRKAIEQCGKMRSDYFLYFEELDWSLRFKKKGLELWYIPSVEIYHEGSHSTGRNNFAKIYYNSRNRLFFAQNNLTGLNRIVSITAQLLFSVPKNSFKSLLKGDINSMKGHVMGAIDFIRQKRGKLHN